MVKSMYAAVAGLKTHQSRMDTIGNNIANVNTWGYKAMSTSFKESMYQKLSGGSSGSTNNGGLGATNPSMIGYGSMVSAIAANFTSGSPSPTDRDLDLYIDGTAFFAVGPIYGSGDAKSPSDISLSRVGDFGVRNGYLVDSNGYYVYGFTMEKGGENKKFNKLDGNVTNVTKTGGDVKTKTDKGVDYSKIVPPGLPQVGSTVTINGKKVVVTAVANDNPGASTADITYVSNYTVGSTIKNAAGNDAEITGFAWDGTNLTIQTKEILGAEYKGPNFDDGRMVFDPDTGGYTMAAGTDEIKPLKIPTECTYYDENGDVQTETNIEYSNFTIDNNGNIYGTSANTSKTYLIGAVALVNVANPNGMTKSNGPYYKLGGSSGEGQVIQAGGETGSLRSGYLEMANVDIATEFSNMITTERGFQANSKIITVTDEMLQELVNMKR